jgi:hypothetical protein
MVRFRWVVPDHPVAATRDHERHTHVLAANSRVIMPAADLVITKVHPALLLLPQSVVMLVCGRVEQGRNAVAFRPGVILRYFRAFGCHRPAAHVQQCLTFRWCDQERMGVLFSQKAGQSVALGVVQAREDFFHIARVLWKQPGYQL